MFRECTQPAVAAVVVDILGVRLQLVVPLESVVLEDSEKQPCTVYLDTLVVLHCPVAQEVLVVQGVLVVPEFLVVPMVLEDLEVQNHLMVLVVLVVQLALGRPMGQVRPVVQMGHEARHRLLVLLVPVGQVVLEETMVVLEDSVAV